MQHPVRALVLGSNSFSGGQLIHTLLEAHAENQITGVSRSAEKSALFLPYKGHEKGRFRFAQLDMVNQTAALIALLDEIQPEVIYNFAALNEVAPSNDHPGDYFLANCVSLANICNALRRRDWLKMFVQISSPEVYGSCAYPIDETAPMDPSTPYAASKGGADLLLRSLWKTFGFPVVFIRSTNYYGRHQQLHKVIPRTVIRIKQGDRLELHGGGKAVKSWIHVRDVARALVACIDKASAGELYHLSDEKNVISVRDVVSRICRHMQKEFDACVRLVDERPGQDAQYVLDYSKAQRTLEWLPREDYDAALLEVVEWIEKNWSEVQESPQAYRHLSPTPA